METTTEALRTLDEALHQLVGCDKERSQLSAQVQQLEQEFMNYCDEPSATATRISKELEKASQVRPPPAPLQNKRALVPAARASYRHRSIAGHPITVVRAIESTAG